MTISIQDWNMLKPEKKKKANEKSSSYDLLLIPTNLVIEDVIQTGQVSHVTCSLSLCVCLKVMLFDASAQSSSIEWFSSERDAKYWATWLRFLDGCLHSRRCRDDWLV